jgi:predicted membrane-bound mannosyltransferase
MMPKMKYNAGTPRYSPLVHGPTVFYATNLVIFVDLSIKHSIRPMGAFCPQGVLRNDLWLVRK